MYFASNRDGYTLALSPAAIRDAIGMPPQTYRDQFIKLLNKGYLVQQKRNLYAFYEKPQNVDKKGSTETNDVLDFDLPKNDTSAVLDNAPAVQLGTENDIEINTNIINNNGLLVKQVSPTPEKSKFVF